MGNGNITKLKIRIKRKIFISEENGFGVFSGKSTPDGSKRIIVGNLFDVREGDTIEVSGEEIFHPRFGIQIKVNTYTNILPEDNEGIVKFLSSGRIKGIGRKTAQKIVERFGNQTFEIIKNNPDQLNTIKGLRKKSITELERSMKESKMLRELIVKLSSFGIGSETVFKIYKEYGDDSMEVLKQNPYMMIGTIRGIGFKRADAVARSLEIPLNSEERIKAGIYFILEQNLERKGHIYIPENELILSSVSLLSIASSDIDSVIISMINNNELVREEIPEPVFLSYKNLMVEKSIAEYLKRLSEGKKVNRNVKPEFNISDEVGNIELTLEQRDAVVSALNNKITIITGGPGTGKTTIIRAIIDSFQNNNMKFFIAAPTGRAAKRIEEASGYQTATIHRMLKINPETMEFAYNEGNPLKADVILIDEFSMVDTFIFYHLLRALKRDTSLIIIGDMDQLPSVGPGNVLRDMINSNYFETIYLKRNFRQTENSLIIENAYRIKKGDRIFVKPYSEDLDFVLINSTDPKIVNEKILRIIDYHKENFTFNSFDYQILSPIYRGESGIDNINKIVQGRFNDSEYIIKNEKKSFKKYDKVMQLKNNYEKEVFNGEQGIIVEKNSDMLFIDFAGNIIEYSIDELDELTLSYAISIHKSQGSEYDFLIIVLLPSQSAMLNRELLYTAVTRAKKKIFVISNEDTLKRAISNSTPNHRRTLLPLRLKERFEKEN